MTASVLCQMDTVACATADEPSFTKPTKKYYDQMHLFVSLTEIKEQALKSRHMKKKNSIYVNF